MENKKIKDLVIDDSVTSFFAVRKKDIREYTRGRFVTLELGDSTGRIAAVIWEPDHFCLTDLSEGTASSSARDACAPFGESADGTSSTSKYPTPTELK